MILTSNTQWWQMFICLAAALVLSTIIGLERQIMNKSAGMRTHALVGVGAALFMVVSKYGFSDVLVPNLVVLDPSRMAAQIVTGIGFIGAGLVFVRRNKVRGLTTASSIWLTAAVGSSAGAGLVLPAVFVTALYFVIVLLYTRMASKIRFGNRRYHLLKVVYVDGTGSLREILLACTELGFQIQGFTTRSVDEDTSSGTLQRLLNRGGTSTAANLVEVELEIEGPASTDALLSGLAKFHTVTSVTIDDESD